MDRQFIEKYVDDYIDMGHFARPEEARPYLIDGVMHGIALALKQSEGSIEPNVDRILNDARAKHHINIENSPDIRALIRYATQIGFNEGYKSAPQETIGKKPIPQNEKSGVYEGDFSKAPCEICHKISSITFRKAPLKHNNDTIPDVLQGFCDDCGAPVSIPHESLKWIKVFLDCIKI